MITKRVKRKEARTIDYMVPVLQTIMLDTSCILTYFGGLLK